MKIVLVLIFGGILFYREMIFSTETVHQGMKNQELFQLGEPLTRFDWEGEDQNILAEIEGNPIRKNDLKAFYENLNLFLPELQRLSFEEVLPVLLQRYIDHEILKRRVSQDNVYSDEEMRNKIETLSSYVVQMIWLDKKVKSEITEAMLKEEYSRFIVQYQRKNEVNLQHILVKDRSLALDIVKSLQRGENFSDLARQYSQDISREQGGRLGYVSAEDILVPFAKTVFSLPKNTYNDIPLHSDLGWHIFYVLDVRLRGIPVYEDVKDVLRQRVYPKVQARLLQDLRLNSDVHYLQVKTNEKKID